MSRSKKKTPCIKIVGNKSNKKDKRIANKLFRRINKVLINKGADPKLIREVTNVYCFKSDGLAIYKSDLEDKFMRK